MHRSVQRLYRSQTVNILSTRCSREKRLNIYWFVCQDVVSVCIWESPLSLPLISLSDSPSAFTSYMHPLSYTLRASAMRKPMCQTRTTLDSVTLSSSYTQPPPLTLIMHTEIRYAAESIQDSRGWGPIDFRILFIYFFPVPAFSIKFSYPHHSVALSVKPNRPGLLCDWMSVLSE